MMKLVHRSPLGELEIAGVPGQVKPGEPFDVPDAIGEGLLTQSDIYMLAPKAKEKSNDDAA